MKRAPRSRQRHDLYAKYHDYDSEISDLLGECGLITAFLAAGATFAQQSSPQQQPSAGAGMMMPNASDAQTTKELKAAMMKMMEEMPKMKFTGDGDVDFMNQMRLHHQGAIDMAKVALANGRDPQVKKLAQDIVAAQEKEIRIIDIWLKKKAK